MSFVLLGWRRRCGRCRCDGARRPRRNWLRRWRHRLYRLSLVNCRIGGLTAFASQLLAYIMHGCSDHRRGSRGHIFGRATTTDSHRQKESDRPSARHRTMLSARRRRATFAVGKQRRDYVVICRPSAHEAVNVRFDKFVKIPSKFA